MSRLFSKILLWFMLTVILSTTASFYIWSVFLRPNQGQFQQPMGTRIWELREARQAWEQEGKAGLERFMARYREAIGVDDVFLTDADGTDLLSGKDLATETKSGFNFGGRGRGRGNNPMFPFVRIEQPRPANFVASTRSRDGKYNFVIIYPNREPAKNSGWSVEVPPQTWWMLGIIATLCYLLARHLTSPLRTMQKTIERFGHGDFSARVNSKRGDELGQLARTVDRMAERIDQLLKSQRRLLQDISHELRSPLARLGVAVELARGGGDANLALTRVEREADRLNTLVGELIQVTRAEGDPEGLTTEAVDLGDLIRVILDDVHIEAQKRQVTLHPAVDEVEIAGNPELLRRAYENIIRNAIRYSPESCQVDVNLEKRVDTVALRVRDYGPGVPPEALPSIFDPFYRVEKDRGRTSGGVGLGLAIARRAVELHHGTMQAYNREPGLEVEIVLPLTAVAEAQRAAAVQAVS